MQILDRDTIGNATRGREVMPLERIVDMAVSRLRQRLRDTGKAPRLIRTVRGSGYLLAAQVVPCGAGSAREWGAGERRAEQATLAAAGAALAARPDVAADLLAVLLAQALSSVIWVSQLRASQMEGLLTAARSLAHSMAASVSYFRSLPLGYRPLVLDQLRSMGGTRFFVSLNERPLNMQVLPETPRKRAVLQAVEGALRQRLGKAIDLSVQFVSPDDLRIFNGEISLDELPAPGRTTH